MAIQGSRRLVVTQQQAWDILRNPDALRRVLPGLDLLEPDGADRYRWGADVDGGQLSGHLEGHVTVGEKQPPLAAVLTFDAKSQTGVAWQGSVQLRLAELVGQACTVACTVHATATGADQSVVDALAAALVDDFLARLGVEAQHQHPPAGADEDDFASTLLTEEAPAGRAGSPLYQDDKKFPTWVWPVLVLVLVGLWWLSQ